MRKILITGISGYLGPYLCNEFSKNEENSVTGIYNSNKIDAGGIELIQCDLANLRRLKEIHTEIKPDIVYHLASVTPMRITDQSENYIEFFNCTVTAEIAKLCAETGSLMIYTSTDLVYDEGENLTEDKSKLNPLTVYAATKLMGEESVKQNAAKYIILRTALVYGFTQSSYSSFFDVAYASLKKGEPVNAFTDQFRNPIYTEDAASMLSVLLSKYYTNDTINFCGNEYLSRYEMCLLMAKEFGFDAGLIRKSSISDFKQYTMVKRLGLSNEKLKNYDLTTGSFEKNMRKSLKYKP